MPFIPPMDEWVQSHYGGVPQRTIEAIGPIVGKRILDIGCGDCMTALGLLNAGAAEVVALDVSPLDDALISRTAERIAAAGFKGAEEARKRLKLVTYDGVRIPLPDDDVDIAFSWGVFEHVRNVRRVLEETRRVLRPSGVGFIKIHPWYPSYYGSHLSDFVEPFAHLKLTPEKLRNQLEAHFVAHPSPIEDLVLGHVWQEFLTLDHYSADLFFEDFRRVGFSHHSWKVLCDPVDLTQAPAGYRLADLTASGSEVVFRK